MKVDDLEIVGHTESNHIVRRSVYFDDAGRMGPLFPQRLGNQGIKISGQNRPTQPSYHDPRQSPVPVTYSMKTKHFLKKFASKFTRRKEVLDS